MPKKEPRSHDSAGRVRFGLIGCGHIGATAEDRVGRWVDAHLWIPYSHAAAITATEAAELVAVCDVRQVAANRARQRYGVSGCYLDYRRMIENERLDVVAIATRTAERQEILERCVRSGIKAVYCEKPLTNTLEAADDLKKLVLDKKVHFVYGTKRRYMPVYQRARELVRAGAIGTLTTIVIRFGDSELLWTHPHSVDIASFFADDAEVKFVQADLALEPSAIQGSRIDTDPKLRMAYIRFANEVGAHIIASRSFDVELIGTKGSLCVRSNGRATHLRCADGDEDSDQGLFLAERVIPTMDRTSGTINSIKALVRAVLDGEPPGYDIGLAVRNQEVLFACVYSHLQGGGKILFPIERRNLTITGRIGTLLP